jgi:hypothetical protein
LSSRDAAMPIQNLSPMSVLSIIMSGVSIYGTLSTWDIALVKITRG